MNEQERIEEVKKLKAQLADLKSKLIDLELPKNYNSLSDDEKKAYNDRQTALKLEALNNIENYSVIKNNNTKFSYPKPSSIVIKFSRELGEIKTNPIIRTEFKKTYSEDVKNKHKKQLEDIESAIDRFNSTKAIRNDRIEFGVNYNNFAETYFTKKACDEIDRFARKSFLEKFDRQKDKNDRLIDQNFKLQNLTDDQRKFYIKARIKFFTDKLNLLLRVAQKKIVGDSRQAQTYLEKNGFISNQGKYRNGSKKFTNVKSTISSIGIDMAKVKNKKSQIKTVKKQSKNERYEKAQHDVIELNLQKERFDDFVKNYRGNGRQFSVEFKQNFPDLAQKTYDKFGSNSIAFQTMSLASSPISVQQHEIEKQFDEELRKNNNRMQYSTDFIPCAQSHSIGFLGKHLTNSKTQTEKNLDSSRVIEYQRELKNIEIKEDLIGYETIFENLNYKLKKDFTKYIENNDEKFNSKSNKNKIAELKKFILEEINKLQLKVHKNKFFSSGVDKIINLSGKFIKRTEKSTTKEFKNILSELTPEESSLYKAILQDINEAKSRYQVEQNLINDLGVQLDKYNNEEFSYENNAKVQKILKDINGHSKKLSIIGETLKNAEERKKNFEIEYASKQIEKASVDNKNLSYNTSNSVFDKYVFPAVDAFGEVYDVEKNSIEGRQVEKIVDDFIMKFKNQVQNMKLSFAKIDNPEISDYVTRLSSNVSNDFGTCIRDVKKTQKLFKSAIEKDAEKDLKNDLDNYLQRLNKIESELIKKLKSMNVEIGNVTLKKNK